MNAPSPIAQHWATIRRTVERGQHSTLHCAIGSVDPDGLPNVTPVGTVFLRDDHSGFYFDQYTSALARNVDANPNVCLMAATDAELRQIEQRVRGTRWLKGNRLLWSSFTQVRDMQFTSFRPVHYPVMMAGLWGGDA